MEEFDAVLEWLGEMSVAERGAAALIILVLIWACILLMVWFNLTNES